MNTGYSILLEEHVEAKGLDYPDCRDFQIVCPSCRDAVYKVGAPDSNRQHLSHYPTSRSDVIACEERVATYDRTRLESEDAESKGQHLRLFQDVFIERSLLSIVKPGKDPDEVLAPIREMIDAAVARPTFRDNCRRIAARTRRDIERPGGLDLVVGDGYGYRNGPHTEFWIQRQIDIALRRASDVTVERDIRDGRCIADDETVIFEFSIDEAENPVSAGNHFLGAEVCSEYRDQAGRARAV